MIKFITEKISIIMKSLWLMIDDFVIRPLASYKFDKTHNISTSGEIGREFFGVQDKNSLSHAVYYQAVPIEYLRILFDLLADDAPETHFIDIGCGKGRACFYAGQKYQRVTGIDFSPKLIVTAQKNLSVFSGTITGEIKFELSDASSYDLPAGSALVYLYNPFDEYILRKFLKRNMEHFLKYKSRIAYVNDVYHDLLIAWGFSREIKYNARRGISIYSLKNAG
jgi:SAM-dependent methyltransferase